MLIDRQPTTLNFTPTHWAKDSALSEGPTRYAVLQGRHIIPDDNRDTDHACLPAKAGTWRFIEQFTFSWVWKYRHT